VRQGDLVTGLLAAVAGDQTRTDGRRKGDRDEPGCAGDEAIEDDRDPGGDRPEHHADERRDLEPAERREDAERVRRIRLVTGERAPDDLDLVLAARLVDARPAAGDEVRVGAGEDRGQGARRGRVADAHLADPDQPGAAGDEALDHLEAHRDRRHCLVARHRGSSGEVPGAGADASRHEPAGPAGRETRRLRDGAGDADIDDRERGADGVREDVDSRPAGDEVGDHLRRHVGRIG
jgi:hypothetical protein